MLNLPVSKQNWAYLRKISKITRIDNTDFVRVNIAKDCNIGLDLDFAFGNSASNAPRPLAIHPLISQSAQSTLLQPANLKLKEAIGVNINLNGKNIPLEIPTGKYTIELAAIFDPTQLIGVKLSMQRRQAKS